MFDTSIESYLLRYFLMFPKTEQLTAPQLELKMFKYKESMCLKDADDMSYNADPDHCNLGRHCLDNL